MKIERRQARDLFRTDLFRYAPVIQALCDELGEVFVTTDVPPGGHFTMYWGVFVIRPDAHYQNPHFHDLYTLHELWHWKQRNPDATHSWLEWISSRADSEFAASLMSECLIYFHISELRDQTFRHPIWVDRFKHLRGQTLTTIERKIAFERHRALNTPEYDNYLEFQIKSYGEQNMQWYRIWGTKVGYGGFGDQAAFRVVEEHLQTPGWQDYHQVWIDDVSRDGIPFLNQAREFEQVYKETNKKWGNQFFDI